MGECLREQGGVEYRELRARSLLNRCDAPRMPFTRTVNPYRGCAMGCRYCYAAYTHEFMGIETPESFHSVVYVKRGHEAETARGLARVVRSGRRIAIGTATDPYQPGEAQAKVTRGFLEQVAQHRNVRVSLVTKGALVLRDVELLQKIHARSALSVHVSLVTPHAELARKLDPWAPPPDVRIEVMRRLVEAGLDVGHALAPVLPGITDDEPSLDLLMGRVRAAGVRHMFAQLLFLRSPTREKFFRWLEAEMPRLGPAYHEAYDARVYLGGGYRRKIDALLARLEERHGFVAGGDDDEEDTGPPEQIPLF
ncbi:MAG TPA: radical SAM protein [Vicinamibacteria bacterium]|nr:radical SAM protein [Vicinamibacteria bacterium]